MIIGLIVKFRGEVTWMEAHDDHEGNITVQQEKVFTDMCDTYEEAVEKVADELNFILRHHGIVAEGRVVKVYFIDDLQ